VRRQYSILIVDDNKLICWGLAKVVSAEGLAVTTVITGGEAIAEVRRTPYDAVFVDVNLPDISGFELLNRIKNLSPGTRVIMMTADNTDENRQKAIESGAARFMGKPFSNHEVREVLRDTVGIGKPESIT
jgi:two-component system response regulator AtoC